MIIMSTTKRASFFWSGISDGLDISRSLYERAADRHRSVGDWLCRTGSAVADFNPVVRPQGSFRFGTVVRPLRGEAEYDLDHIVIFKALSTADIRQKELKALLGQELVGYAQAHGMQPPTEHNRCWRLDYRDEVPFHLDSLPCVPANQQIKESLQVAGVEQTFAHRAIAITDRRQPGYESVHATWLTSNPSGFARWFEQRAALGRDAQMVEKIRAGTVEDVPPYTWRTPLQRSIQILKRHRDVMFAAAPKLAPISMIITNLAAHAYQGELDVAEALQGIVDRMGNFVRRDQPRVPNPTHPQEDYADKWSRNPDLEPNFWRWLTQVHADVERFSDPFADITADRVKECFDAAIPADPGGLLVSGAPAVLTSNRDRINPTIRPRLESGPKPWMSVR